MISIKPLASLVLMGLGSATVGTDVYLAGKPKPVAPTPEVVTTFVPPAASSIVVVTTPEPDPNPVVVLPPLTIENHRSKRAVTAKPPAQELVVCSNWRELESGPSGHGVRNLCVVNVPANGAPLN
ncbi:MAG TPA: hypothetical protein VH142_28070 [Polyangiaceae bacterium]|jgi:hypothetical protein|nr:hypothetical protein [Polyangiaceae bacterium]